MNGAQWTLWALIVPVAAFLRLHAISAKSLWLDEAMSAGIARLPWSQFFRVLWNREINMTLYYLLLRLWIHAGSSEAFLRGLSLIFSVATVPLLYTLGTRLFGRTAGLAAALLLALSAYQIRYAQEARAYALVAFLATLATFLLVRNLQSPATARWGAYSAVCALVVYAQILGALLILAHAFSLLALPRDSTRDKGGMERLRPQRALVHLADFAGNFGDRPAHRLHARGMDPHAHRRRACPAFFESAAGNHGFVLVILDAALLRHLPFAVFGKVSCPASYAAAPTRMSRTCKAGVGAGSGLAICSSDCAPGGRPRCARFSRPLRDVFLAGPGARRRRRFSRCLRPSSALRWTLLAAISVLSIQGTFTRYYHQDFDIYREDWRSAISLYPRPRSAGRRDFLLHIRPHSLRLLQVAAAAGAGRARDFELARRRAVGQPRFRGSPRGGNAP